MLKSCTLLVVTIAILLGGYKYAITGTQRMVDKENDSILITGSSSGIGKHAALSMNAVGFTVFAGVRNKQKGEILKNLAPNPEKLIPIILDVTKDDQIAAAVKFIDDYVGDKGLTAVFNNAGVSGAGANAPFKSGAVENYPVDGYRWVMEVNFFGMLKVTKAFLTLVKKSKNKGRIIFNTSVCGIFSMPFASPYTSSKFATEALADSLRREVHIFGTKVSILEPGYIFSEMTCTDVKDWVNKESNYPAERVDSSGSRKSMESPLETSKALLDSVLNSKPLARYLMGGQSTFAWIASKFPEPMIDTVINKASDNPLTDKEIEELTTKCQSEMFDVSYFQNL